MEAFGNEGMVYLETQVGLDGYVKTDGTAYSTDEVRRHLPCPLASPKDAVATGVTVRFQNALLRFVPNAEDRLRELYAINDKYRDLYVGVNMVGREDNDKGYPLRFLPVLRELRHKYPEINLSIHAGEVDEPNFHIRDTLLLGAQRIGHGVNLITDPDTMLLMRNGPYMVEINLVSNLLLEYVQNYSQHPFPEYLRTGHPSGTVHRRSRHVGFQSDRRIFRGGPGVQPVVGRNGAAGAQLAALFLPRPADQTKAAGRL